MESYTSGRCSGMCPPEEVTMREREGLIHYLETRREGTFRRSYCRSHKAVAGRAVKAYRRTAAGAHDINVASAIRPTPVLESTVHYLMTEVMNVDKVPFLVRYDFIQDRLRSIRQDIVIQQPPPLECIPLLEPMVRFYIFSAFIIGNRRSSEFDPVLNSNHLLECLKWLLNLYDEDSTQSESRIEMEACYLAVNLGDHHALMRSLSLPLTIRTGLVLQVEKLSLRWMNNLFCTVCLGIKSLPPLLSAAIVSHHIQTIRRRSLDILSSSYSSTRFQYPINKLKLLLLYNDQQELISDCALLNLTTTQNGIQFSKKSFNRNVLLPVEFSPLSEICFRLSKAVLPEVLLGATLKC